MLDEGEHRLDLAYASETRYLVRWPKSPGYQRAKLKKTLLEGITIGVIVGLILSLFNIGYQKYMEHEQVKYINETLSNSYVTMCGMQGSVRMIHFEGMLDILLMLLRNRATHIRYDKSYDLFLSVTEGSSFFKMYERGYDLSMEDVDSILFEKLRDPGRFSWLRLPGHC